MSLMMNEKSAAINIINTCDLGKKPFASLSTVARYYASNGMRENDIRNSIEGLLKSHGRGESSVAWSDALDRISRYAAKHPMVSVDHIDISNREMDTISGIDGIQTKRLAFALLCIAKYRNKVSSKNDNWVSCPDPEVISMANIKTTSKRQCAMYKQLKDSGLIKFSSHIDNLNVQVQFIEDGDTVLTIDDMRNLGYQLMMYYGYDYMKCQCCGLTVKINNPNKTRGRDQIYCNDCAYMLRIKNTVDSVMRGRNARQSNKMKFV